MRDLLWPKRGTSGYMAVLVGVLCLASMPADDAAAMQTISTAGTVIDGQTIDGTKAPYAGNFACIYVTANNVTIKNSKFTNCFGSGGAINAENNSNVLIQGNTFENVSMGVYMQGTTGNAKVLDNKCHNLNAPGDMASCVKYNGARGAGNEVARNIVTQDPGYGNTEDVFSFFNTQGTALSPVDVHDNCVNAGNNQSDTGTAFNAGDSGGENITMRNNTVINSTGGGMAITGGTNIWMLNNKIQCRGVNTGRNQWCQMSTWDYGGVGCTGARVEGNQVDIVDSSGNRINGYQDLGGCNPTMSGNNFLADLGGPISCGGAPSPPPSVCVLPWGGTLASDSLVTAYKDASVIAPATCVSEQRKCTGTTLSGTYTKQTCTVQYPNVQVGKTYKYKNTWKCPTTADPNKVCNQTGTTIISQ